VLRAVQQMHLGAIGWLGRRDLRNRCRSAMTDGDEACRATAAWSLSLFPERVRLPLGRQIEPAHRAPVLRTGNQPQRAAAALELAVLAPGQPLFEVSTPALRLVRLLAASTGTAAEG
jgi:hypothetical protein